MLLQEAVYAQPVPRGPPAVPPTPELLLRARLGHIAWQAIVIAGLVRLDINALLQLRVPLQARWGPTPQAAK